ncbi:NUDIX hydrolase [Virgibacillus sp. DJP39]|uniref:NUDIX hydrolase n=1 Tax=Virgibacillus sp. DJP39 TaxID=3409790 RepID=UPI003BB650D3
MYKYTICLIRKGERILLLNRNKKPTMGLWNGVGGKIEENETPYEGVIRETFEETAIQLDSVTYKGNVIFKDKDEIEDNEGMYVFIADLPDEAHIATPLHTDEGILEWKSIDWILDDDNRGVISNLKKYLPRILEDDNNLEHTFIYENHTIVDYITSILSENDMNKRYEKHLVSNRV